MRRRLGVAPSLLESTGGRRSVDPFKGRLLHQACLACVGERRLSPSVLDVCRRQQFSVCFACEVTGGELSTTDESSEVKFVEFETATEMNMTASMLRRIEDYRSGIRGGF